LHQVGTSSLLIYELVHEEAHYQMLWYQSKVDFCLLTLCILEF